MSRAEANTNSIAADGDASLDDLAAQIDENRHVGASLHAGRAALKSLTISWVFAAALALAGGASCAWFLLESIKDSTAGRPEILRTLLSLGLSGCLLVFILCLNEVFRFLSCLAKANIALAANESAIMAAQDFARRVDE